MPKRLTEGFLSASERSEGGGGFFSRFLQQNEERHKNMLGIEKRLQRLKTRLESIEFRVERLLLSFDQMYAEGGGMVVSKYELGSHSSSSGNNSIKNNNNDDDDGSTEK